MLGNETPVVTRTRGFTLIEVVIVLAIIAIVFALAMPKLTSTREKAYVAALKTDLRNLQTQQTVFYEHNKRYTTDLDSLDFVTSKGVQLEMHSTQSSWEAVTISESAGRICRANSTSVDVECPDAVLHRPVSRLDSLVARLPWAATMVQGPTRTWVGNTKDVKLVLDPSYQPTYAIDTIVMPGGIRDSLRATIVGDPGDDRVSFRPVRRSERMIARLEGNGFAIDPDPSQEARLTQGVLSSRRTEWTWRIRALEPGHHQLRITLDAFVEGYSDTPVRFQVLAHEIDVAVTLKQYVAGFVGRNWTWLLMLILAPPTLITAIWRWYKNRKPHEAREWEKL